MELDILKRKKQKIRLDIAENGCNLKCEWCHKDYFPSNQNSLDHNAMNLWVAKLITLFPNTDIEIILSGNGEPLLSNINEIETLIVLLKKQKEISSIKLITNGTINDNNVFVRLKKAGLTAVNISINTLSREKYIKIYKQDLLIQVLKTLEIVLNLDLEVKVNCIFAKFNEEEINDFISLSEKYNISIKFLDFIDYIKYYIPLEKLITNLLSKFGTYKQEFNTYSYKIFERDNCKLIIKNSEINTCSNISCNKRHLCLEGCRASIRLNREGTIFPCGAKKENQIKITCANDVEIINALIEGGKLWNLKK